MVPAGLRRDAYILNAGPLGWLEGVTIVDGASNGRPLLHYFGGVPYGLSPVGKYRFRQARELPAYYQYGTEANPGRFGGTCAVCPQPNARGTLNEKLWDENCLQLNIYIPTGIPPSKGWPVFFNIHGGFLQCGTPNISAEAMAPLLSETAFQAIIVSPAYRLNVLGFLASYEIQAEAQRYGEPIGNQGFWDQRLALEWTAQHIRHFGGDGDNITVGGYSAGGHSAYQQLAHELFKVPDHKAIIRRVIMWSSSPGPQPKTLAELQRQFDELLTVLRFPLTLSATEKLKLLREKPTRTLITALSKMKLTEFRALSDGDFVPKDVIGHINRGEFARRMKARGIRLMNGECRDEHFSYRTWRTPANSYDAVALRLCADYPERVVHALLDHRCNGKERRLPPDAKDWQDAFGRLYAEMQIHSLERGFHNALVRGGLEPGRDLLRYRLDWRTEGSKQAIPAAWGVTHASDLPIWFWGVGIGGASGGGLLEHEKKILRSWNAAFEAFVRGDETVSWGTSTAQEMRRLRSDGETDVWVDDRWDDGVTVWEAVNGKTVPRVLGWLHSRL